MDVAASVVFRCVVLVRNPRGDHHLWLVPGDCLRCVQAFDVRAIGDNRLAH
ncbi:hypothetical protein D3C71_2170600 [compost metagenome]